MLVPVGNNVDPSAKIGRTREAIVGIQHELISNLAIGVDYIYRKYDHGTATYTVGYQPGAPGYPLSQIYTGPQTFTDPVTGQTAPYYTICDGCARPSGLGSILMTNPNYQIYHGVDITATKRFSNRWQMQSALTLQVNPNYFPDGSASFINPTNRPFQEGVSTIEPWIFKLQGSYTLPWDIIASGNLNMYDGATRTLTINGPGQVYGGTTGTIIVQHAGVHVERRAALRPHQAARPRRSEGLPVQRRPSAHQTDPGWVQHVQHQHDHGLCQRQQEHGGLHAAEHDRVAARLPYRDAVRVLARIDV